MPIMSRVWRGWEGGKEKVSCGECLSLKRIIPFPPSLPSVPPSPGTGLLKQQVPGLKSLIAKASEAKADVLLEDKEKIR